MGVYKFAGELSLELMVDEDAFLKGELFRLQFELIDEQFRLVFFGWKEGDEVDLDHFRFDIGSESFLIRHNDYYVTPININITQDQFITQLAISKSLAFKWLIKDKEVFYC
jgi:hypothetical protein